MKTLKKYDQFVNELAGFEAETFKKGVQKVKDFFKGEVSREKAIEIINDHSMKRRLYQSMIKTNPEKAEKLIDFIMIHPNTQYFTWNDEEGKFTETGFSGMKESLRMITEKKKASPAQIAARKKFAEMVAGKKSEKDGEVKDDDKKDDEVKDKDKKDDEVKDKDKKDDKKEVKDEKKEDKKKKKK